MKHSAFSQRLSGKLRLKEHILTATPGLDPLIFNPVGTIQETVLTRNVNERVMGFPSTAIPKALVATVKKITGYTCGEFGGQFAVHAQATERMNGFDRRGRS